MQTENLNLEALEGLERFVFDLATQVPVVVNGISYVATDVYYDENKKPVQLAFEPKIGRKYDAEPTRFSLKYLKTGLKLGPDNFGQIALRLG